MLKITGLVLAAALTAGVAHAQTIKPADEADLQCMAVMLIMAENAERDSAERQGAFSGTWYFLGRLEGRTPEVDWLARLRDLLPTTVNQNLDPWAERCMAEFVARGQAMMES